MTTKLNWQEGILCTGTDHPVMEAIHNDDYVVQLWDNLKLWNDHREYCEEHQKDSPAGFYFGMHRLPQYEADGKPKEGFLKSLIKPEDQGPFKTQREAMEAAEKKFNEILGDNSYTSDFLSAINNFNSAQEHSIQREVQCDKRKDKEHREAKGWK